MESFLPIKARAHLTLKNIVSFLLISAAVFFITAIIANAFLLKEFLGNIESFPPLLVIQLFFSLLFSTFLTPLSLILAILISLLFAFNILLLWKSSRWKNLLRQKTGLLGMGSAILGIGCLACSSLLPLAAVFLFGTGFVSATLPFHSIFFQVLSIILLCISSVLSLQVITKQSLLSPPTKSFFFKKIALPTFLFIILSGILFAYHEEIGYLAWQRLNMPRLAIFLAPTHTDLRFAVGNHYFGDGTYDVDLAKKHYIALIRLDEQYPGAHYQLSRILFIEGSLHQALVEINKELEYHPDYQRSYYVRGLVYGYLQLFENAAEDFETFLRSSPENWAGHNDLAWIYFQMGQYDKVLSTTDAALRYHPENVWLLNSRGVALMNMNRHGEAKTSFEQALALSLKMTPASWGRAYPGNNPAIHNQGLTAMQDSIRKNLELLSSE